MKKHLLNLTVQGRMLLFFGLFTTAFLSCKNSEEPLIEQFQQRSIKRGVSYNFQVPDDANLLGKGISWFYNWGPNITESVNTPTLANKIDFIPMAWNGSFNAVAIRAFKTLHPECEYLLGFNEPNLTDQANMTPTVAAQKWVAFAALAKELNMKLISPAMNYGTLANYADPIVWLDEFFTLVPLSSIDGIAIHCYMSNASAMASYVKRFKKYGKPLWMTEFCAWEKNITSVNAQMTYMSEAINYLECNADIARYAWFIPRASGSVDSYPFMQLLTKTTPYELSPLGKVFVNMSTQDKTVFYPEMQKIPAEHYSSLNLAEAVAKGIWEEQVHLRPTTDVDGDLDVTDFNSDLWLEYQVKISDGGSSKIALRYTSLYNADLQIMVDGTLTTSVSLPKTGSESSWTTLITNLPLSSGKHTLRIKNAYGGTTLNWLMIIK